MDRAAAEPFASVPSMRSARRWLPPFGDSGGLRARHDVESDAQVRGDRQVRGGGRSSGVLVGATLSLGAVLVLAAGVVLWSSWQGRSAVPLDDQLPYLLGADASSQDTAEVVSGASPGTAEAAAALEPVQPERSPPPQDAAVAAGAAGDGGERGGDGLVVVYVSGAVVDPGVVELDTTARVHHAVAAAGGATVHADLERVNLAALLVDGERIHVPEVGDDATPEIVSPSRSPDNAVVSGASDEAAPIEVDINRASVAELESLPGIGPSIARSILDLRTARGAYASVDELLLVDGIGPAKLETLRPHAFVSGD